MEQPIFKTVWLPKDLVYVGCPIADLIRYNAERGECGPGSVEEHVRKRLHWMKVGSAHEFERIRKDGRVIQMREINRRWRLCNDICRYYGLPCERSRA